MNKKDLKRSFILKRVEKLQASGDLICAVELLHKLDPLPCPFDVVLQHIQYDKLKEGEAYPSRLAMTIRLCLRTIRIGKFTPQDWGRV